MSFTCLHLICTQTPFRVHLRNALSPDYHPPPQAEVFHKQENCKLFRAFPVYHQGIWKKGKGLSHPLPGRVGKSHACMEPMSWDHYTLVSDILKLLTLGMGPIASNTHPASIMKAYCPDAQTSGLLLYSASLNLPTFLRGWTKGLGRNSPSKLSLGLLSWTVPSPGTRRSSCSWRHDLRDVQQWPRSNLSPRGYN